jgi:transposase
MGETHLTRVREEVEEEGAEWPLTQCFHLQKLNYLLLRKIKLSSRGHHHPRRAKNIQR